MQYTNPTNSVTYSSFLSNTPTENKTIQENTTVLKRDEKSLSPESLKIILKHELNGVNLRKKVLKKAKYSLAQLIQRLDESWVDAGQELLEEFRNLKQRQVGDCMRNFKLPQQLSKNVKAAAFFYFNL